jgi:hypothetical protein
MAEGCDRETPCHQCCSCSSWRCCTVCSGERMTGRCSTNSVFTVSSTECPSTSMTWFCSCTEKTLTSSSRKASSIFLKGQLGWVAISLSALHSDQVLRRPAPHSHDSFPLSSRGVPNLLPWHPAITKETSQGVATAIGG